MVGRAGGSKGCSTCRKRKIACDLTKPQCRQCIKSHRQCDGPVDTSIFLHNFQQGSQTRTRIDFLTPDGPKSSSHAEDGSSVSQPQIVSKPQKFTFSPDHGSKIGSSPTAHRKACRSIDNSKPVSNPKERVQRQSALSLIQNKHTASALYGDRLCMTPFKTNEEFFGFEFFRNSTAPYMIRFSKRPEWIEVALQASLYFPAVKELLIALAFAHMGTKGGEISAAEMGVPYLATIRREDLYMEHYGQALKLLSRSKQPPVELILVCCLLFHCCEHFVGEHVKAFKHVESGMKLLESGTTTVSYQDQELLSISLPVPHTSIVESSLEPEFDMIMHGRAYREYEAVPLDLKDASRNLVSRPLGKSTSGTPCRNFFQSRDMLDPILKLIFATFYSQQAIIKSELHYTLYDLHELFDPWHSSFVDLKKSFSTDLENHAEAAVLEIQSNLASTALLMLAEQELKLPEDKQSQLFDSTLESHFQCLLQSCANYVRIISDRDDDCEGWLGMCHGLIPALYFTTVNCRNTKLRREAIRLLHRAERYEYALNSCIAAKIAEAVLSIEEQGLARIRDVDHIPDLYRIRVVKAEKASNCQISLNYTRAPHHDVEYVELIEHRSMSLDKPQVAWPIDLYLTEPGYQGIVLYRKAPCRC